MSESTRALPTGREFVISHGDERVVVVEVGGGLRDYTVAGESVLDGFAKDEMHTPARGTPLVPWPNRLHQGQYEWEGQQLQAPINEPDKNNALHGFTRFMNWTPVEVHEDRVSMRLRLHAQQGYPFVLDVEVEYALGVEGLTVTATAENVGATAAPYGFGQHPYLTVGTEHVDQAVLSVPARTYLPTDESQIPTGRAPLAGTPYDFRDARPIGPTQIDYAYTDLERDAEGRAHLELASPDGRREIDVWVDEAFPYLEVFTGDTVPQQHRRRRGLGVEPMTCPPNAFATGEDVRRLEPGEVHRCQWGMRPHLR